MKLKETRLLKQVGTNHIYVWTEILASRTDMVEFVPEQKAEAKPAEPEPTPEPKPFKIEKSKKIDLQNSI